ASGRQELDILDDDQIFLMSGLRILLAGGVADNVADDVQIGGGKLGHRHPRRSAGDLANQADGQMGLARARRSMGQQRRRAATVMVRRESPREFLHSSKS